MDDDEREIYNKEYTNKIADLTAGVKDEDKRKVLFDQLTKMTYQPSTRGDLDAELNFLRADRTVRIADASQDKSTKSYAKYIQRVDGLSKSQIRKMMLEKLLVA
jgi:hypothetical protein